jgi:hypothetical protein
MPITWTKNWSGSDDGTVLKGVDLGNIQGDMTAVLQTTDIGTSIQAFDQDLTDLTDAQNINPANLVKNGAMDTFTGSSPDDWTPEGGAVEAQETTDVQIGANSYSITSDADGSASRQTIYATIGASDNTFWRGKEVTLTAQVYATDVSNARIQIDDGASTSESVYHTGTTGWEELTITRTIDNTATKLDVVLLVDGNAQTAFFDAVRLNHGPLRWQFVHHRSDV